jgi:hypothetical protein
MVAERRAGDDALLVLRLFRNRAFAIGAGQSLVADTGMFGNPLISSLSGMCAGISHWPP